MTVKTFNGLPEKSFTNLPSTGEVICIVRGVTGYTPMEQGGRTADELNELFDVTPAQAEAMAIGSMFGWDVPGANPDRYDESGRLKKA